MYSTLEKKKLESGRKSLRRLHDLVSPSLSNFISYLFPLAHCTPGTLSFLQQLTHQTHSYLTALCINLHVGGPLSVIQNSPSSLTPQKGLPQYTLYHLTLIILSIPITILVTVSLPL